MKAYPIGLIMGALLAGALAVSGQGTSGQSVVSLGEVVVMGMTEPAGVGTATEVQGDQAELQNRRDLAGALALAPGVTLTRVGGRNEIMASVRGFDTRQVPLFIDGIPIYVPYDGNVDMGRLDVFSASELTLAKGYSSVLYGPNALGGAINVLSRRPSQPEELDVRAGATSGKGWESAVRAGLLRQNGYALAGVSWRERDYFRLSDDFKPVATENGGARENSDSRDIQIMAKAGWTPGGGEDELAVGFVRQDSEKGLPPYAGHDPRVLPRYWRYTDWIKNSVYAVGHKTIGQTGYLKPRIYYDTYENTVKAFDDDTYTTQTKRSSWTSVYDDYSFGGSLEGGGQIGERHQLGVAAHYKQDVHREHNVGDPWNTIKDETWALAGEDHISLTEWLSLSAGLGVEGRHSLKARDAETGDAFPHNDNLAVNPQAGLFWAVTGGVVRATIAHKTRFPTLKDRYSYRLGTALPNPDLDPERALHYEVGYDGRVAERVRGRASIFYSRLDDTIQRVNHVAQDEEGAWLYQLQNVGKAEQVGAEIGATWQVVDGLAGGVDYLYMHRKNLDQSDLKPADIPEHTAKFHLEWAAFSRLTLVPSVEYSSSHYSLSNSTKVDGYWLCHLDARLKLTHGVELYAGIHNLLDENYELDEGYPEEGRNFYVGAQYRF